MLKELSEDRSSINKTKQNKQTNPWSETKDKLIEIKNNLQGNNSRVDQAENQIHVLKHKKVKNNQSKQQEEKRIQKMRIV